MALLDSSRVGRSRDGDDDGHPRPLRKRQEPVDGNLGRSAALLPREGLHLFHELEINLEVLVLEPRQVAPHVV